MKQFTVPSLAALVLGGSIPAAAMGSDHQVSRQADADARRADCACDQAPADRSDCPYAEVDARRADSPYQEIAVPHVPYSHGVIYRGWDAADMLTELVGKTALPGKS